MDLFEYVMVIVSIVLGLSLAQVLRGFGQALRTDPRHAGTIAWLVVLFVQHLQLWWWLWSLAGVDRWTHGAFFLVALVPCSLFAATDALVTAHSGPGIGTRDHFDRVGPWFYSFFLLFLFLSVMWTWRLMELPLDHAARVLELTGALMAVMGLAWPRRKIHALGASVYLVTMILAQWVFMPMLYGG